MDQRQTILSPRKTCANPHKSCAKAHTRHTSLILIFAGVTPQIMEKLGKILIVDDNQDILFALNLLLTPRAEKVKVATSPDRIPQFMKSFGPDLVLLYGIGDAQSAVTDKLRELGIPYMYIGEYVEESPLGRAEWVVLLGEVTDRREESEAAFRVITERYERLKAETAETEGRKKVMVNTPWQDTWYMPSTRSVIARLIEDAGGDYIYKENETNGSLPVGMETAYRLLREADVWIETGQCASLADLLAVNPRFAEAKAVRTGQVYNNNRRLTPGGGNDYWESAVVRPDVVLRDLIRILHPEDGEGELYYYRQLK